MPATTWIHGDDDRNVPFRPTADLVEKLRAKKVAFEELIFPDEIHDLLRWSDWIRAYRTTAQFFDRKLVASGERQYVEGRQATQRRVPHVSINPESAGARKSFRNCPVRNAKIFSTSRRTKSQLITAPPNTE
jgi:hypothetical protein